MTSGPIVQMQILENCSSGFISIISLIGEEVKRSSLYRQKDELLKKGWLETDGKNKYRTTPEGQLQLKAATGEIPKSLSKFYPLLAKVPTLQHKAIVELAIAAVIARKYNLRSDHHPTLIIVGPTLTWKTSTGLFLCYLLGLDSSTQIVNSAAS